jgi:site-specific DNA-methyltransferase (adenine-specific)
MSIQVIEGDSLLVLPTLPADSFHAIVTDPPYGLEFMGKEWDGSDGFRRSLNAADAGRDDVFGRTSQKAPEFKTGASWQTGAGFSKPGIGERQTAWPSFTGGNDQFGGANPTCATCGGRARGKKKCACVEPDWRVKGAAPDRQYGRHRQMLTYQQWCEAWAHEALRVLKPGGHMLAFGGTRTYHRLVCAIEDAGFEIRDAIMWHYGSGFPKSLDVSKAIDKAARAEREVIAEGAPVKRMIPGADQDATGSWVKDNGREFVPTQTVPATDAARKWSGWGTALKPATEIICVARKPLIGTVVANVLAHGTGALNIDGCRVDGPMDGVWGTSNATVGRDRMFNASPEMGEYRSEKHPAGRWPANVIHDGSEEVVAAFPQAPGQMAAVRPDSGTGQKTDGIYGAFGTNSDHDPRGDAGSAARFFYCAKADKGDRADSKHPTVKPLALFEWLVKLVTPPGGHVLDCFAGSGIAGEACMKLGFDCTMIERDPQHAADIRHRIKRWSGQDTPLFAAAD